METLNKNKSPKSRTKILGLVVLIIVVVLGILGFNWYIDQKNYISTDDAQVTGDVLSSSSKIPGKVVKINVADGDQIKKGQVLFSLETDQAQNQVNQASAALEIAMATLNKAAGGANNKLSLTIANASNKDIAIIAAQVKAAKAAYDLAELNLSNTIIKAPVNGTIVQLSIHEGDIIGAGQPAISIVDFSKLQVTANVLESDLERVGLGKEVSITIDSFPGVKFSGTVKEKGLATASVFNLFSSVNATGNFTKVSQRIPIKINFDPKGEAVIPGMSTEVKIKAN